MWNDKKSLILSKCCVILFLALLLTAAVAAPKFVMYWFLHVTYGRTALFLITIYSGCVPAAALLVLLYVLLSRIGREQVFVAKNTECLRGISWCCFAGAATTASSAFYWFPWLAVAVAAAFMGLVVRVVKNVFAKAVSLQDEAEFTI